ncbi:lysozyme inhibitor LprI family protein [Maribellus maritimus]|uniref:lysozyme inhibitor LprI family protein n=1 Tax=Maribellus maritimus TaxID=2870838 RepID=UPI001EEC8369|nr:lysozyme inhibitor LprI family protein [Maribellus maritimus]MCG6191408.1 DUF1311 domain-containing protein [Maribellus maritimus]
MKIQLAVFILISFNFTTVAQIDFNNPPWEKKCEELSSQSEMNICSYESFLIADSILNTYYDSLFSYLDSQYLNELKLSSDTSDNYRKEYLKQLSVQKEFVISSKKDFNTFRKSTSKIVEYQYKGGTIQPMIVNIYARELTVNQIKVLINLMEEIMN